MATHVRVYAGDGVSQSSLLSTLESLRSSLSPQWGVSTLSAAELLAGGWQRGCELLVFPGGRDSAYLSALGPAGARAVTAFVDAGGSYLGLCAGAYFGAAACVFEASNPALRVVGPRLALAPVAAVGSVWPGFAYGSESGAVVASVTLSAAAAAADADWCTPAASPDAAAPPSAGCAYFNGGCCFRPPADDAGADEASAPPAPGCCPPLPPGVDVLATYSSGPACGAAALVRAPHGRGAAVLCGCHPEAAPHWAAGDVARQLTLRAEERARLWRATLRAARAQLRRPRPAAPPAAPTAAAGAGAAAAAASPLRSIGPGPVLSATPRGAGGDAAAAAAVEAAAAAAAGAPLPPVPVWPDAAEAAAAAAWGPSGRPSPGARLAAAAAAALLVTASAGLWASAAAGRRGAPRAAAAARRAAAAAAAAAGLAGAAAAAAAAWGAVVGGSGGSGGGGGAGGGGAGGSAGAGAGAAGAQP